VNHRYYFRRRRAAARGARNRVRTVFLVVLTIIGGTLLTLFLSWLFSWR